MIENIDVTTLKKWLEDKNTILIDVREDSEWEEGYISGAVHIPLSTVSLKKLPQNNNDKIVFYCRSGKRSMVACQKIEYIDNEAQLYNLTGGIIAWQEIGYSVQRS